MSWENSKEWDALANRNQADRSKIAGWNGMLLEKVLQAREQERNEQGEVTERDEVGMNRWLQDIIRDIKEIPANVHSDLIKQHLDETYRFGPLQPLWDKPDVSDIQVFVPHNPIHKQFILYKDKDRIRKEYKGAGYRDYDHVRDWVNHHLSRIGMRYDPSKITLDGMLPGGERIHVISGPSGYSLFDTLAGEYIFVRCMVISIRRFVKAFSLEELTTKSMTQPDQIPLRGIKSADSYHQQIVYAPRNGGIADPATMDFLRIAVKLKLNHLVLGGTGTGKTTMLNALTVVLPENEIPLIIEESPEMQPQCFAIRVYERPGTFSQADGLKNALRMYPSRIYISELRDSIAYQFIQAIMSGHDGSGSTVHASSCKAGMDRTIDLASGHPSASSKETISRILYERLGFVLHMEERDGEIVMDEVCEVNDDGTLHTISRYVSGLDEHNRSTGYFEFKGPTPKFVDKMLRAGMEIPLSWKWGKKA